MNELTISPAEYVKMQIMVRKEFKPSATSRRDREQAKFEVDEILNLNGISIMGKTVVNDSPVVEELSEPVIVQDNSWQEGNYFGGTKPNFD